MKKRVVPKVSFILALLMLAGSFASCKTNPPDTNTTEPITEVITESEIAQTSESEVYTEEIIAPLLEGEHALLIENADHLKNNVTAYYSNGDRTAFTVENKGMIFEYPLAAETDQLATIKNQSGKVYVENTMDVYVTMENGKTYYTSKSVDAATANFFRYGYYYYDIHMYDQSFTNEILTTKETDISFARFTHYNDMSKPVITDGVMHLESTSSKDPYITAKTNIPTKSHNAISVTMKSESSSSLSVYIAAGSHKNASEAQRVSIPLVSDGEYHTYVLPIDGVEDYTGNITLVRLDFSGAAGEKIAISEIKAINLEGDGAPALRLDRNLHTYSDKINQILHFVAEEDVSGIKELGMITKIASDTVSKLVVKDKNGEHTSLDGVDWSSAEYIGFDIKNVGIFGYILLPDASSGMITITLEGENFIIKQVSTPEGGIIKQQVQVSSGDEIIKNFKAESTKVYNSENDYYFGQRLYADNTHSFDNFLEAAYCERNPLSDKNFVIDDSVHPATYDGYDPIRGIYCFTSLKSQSFGGAYYNTPNQHNGVSFKITGDNRDRNIYVLAYAHSTSLECSAVLDENGLMLPIPVEVSKNFSHEFEVPKYSWGDICYSEAYIPIALKAEESKALTILHLYQNWGKYPLKQLSSIQYYSPYYHLSTGCTETNCIATHYVHGKDLWTLPDHRAMSAPLWAGDPQHTSGGNHYFLQYTDSDGNRWASENILNIIDSAGPTYADVDMTYLSDDGRIKVTYSHSEMPQTDENRTYYEISYEVLEGVSFKDFSRDFSFYSCDGFGPYEMIGYLDESNKSVVKANNATAEPIEYVLGDNCPYFDMFKITTGAHGDPSHPNYSTGYVNLSFLIYNSEFIIGGKECNESFVIVNKNNLLSLSLDLDEVTLKKGDKFSINAIIMPWGSQKTNYNTDTPDKNVRDTRLDTLLNPVKPVAINNCEIIESVFVPKIRSLDGESAEFAIEGGQGNITFRVYGFKRMTAPKLYELIDGQWVLIDVSSMNTPDSKGNRHAYDGYCIHYDGDGTFSYSFVTTIKDGAKRTFKVLADEDFKSWPEMPDISETVDLNLLYNAEKLNTIAISGGQGLGEFALSEDSSYVRFFGNGSGKSMDAYVTTGISGEITSGQYAIIKYRIPKSNPETKYTINYFTSTTAPSPTGQGDYIVANLIQDGEWHVLIVNLAKYGLSSFSATGDSYKAKFIRIDFLNQIMSKSSYVDFAYFAMTDDLNKICLYNSSIEQLDYTDTPGEYKILLSETCEFVKEEVTDTSSPNDYLADMLNLYISPVDIFNSTGSKKGVGLLELREENAFVRIYGNGESGEGNMVLYSGGTNVTGKYFVIKYRLPTTNVEPTNILEIFSSTVNNAASGSDVAQIKGIIKDGEWHTLIVDITTYSTCTTFKPASDGSYSAKYLRFDFFDRKMAADSYIDIAFIGICDDPAEIEAELNK